MTTTKKLPAAEYLNECLKYTKSTGELLWRVRPDNHFSSPRIAKGWNTKYAGTLAGNGLGSFRLDHEEYQAHRVIWVMVTGTDPGKLEIDHRDTDPTNNRWRNLRLATRSNQTHNTSRRILNTSGVKGVHWNSRDQRWVVQVRVNRRMGFRGDFIELEEAVRAVNRARKRLHASFANNG
jgi:hypothetical protein